MDCTQASHQVLVHVWAAAAAASIDDPVRLVASWAAPAAVAAFAAF